MAGSATVLLREVLVWVRCTLLGVVQTQRKSASQIWRGTGQDGFGNGDQQLD